MNTLRFGNNFGIWINCELYYVLNNMNVVNYYLAATLNEDDQAKCFVDMRISGHQWKPCLRGKDQAEANQSYFGSGVSGVRCLKNKDGATMVAMVLTLAQAPYHQG